MIEAMTFNAWPPGRPPAITREGEDARWYVNLRSYRSIYRKHSQPDRRVSVLVTISDGGLFIVGSRRRMIRVRNTKPRCDIIDVLSAWRDLIQACCPQFFSVASILQSQVEKQGCHVSLKNVFRLSIESFET